MMTKIVVTGVGLVSALGDSAEQCWQALFAGRSAIALRHPFLELPPLPLAMLGKYPARLDDLVTRVVQAALEDAKLHPPLSDCGVVIGSSRSHLGDLEQISGYWRKHQGLPDAMPPDAMRENSTADLQWLHCLPHQPATFATQLIGSLGPTLAPMAACATGIWAIAQGCELIRQGVCQSVIAGAVESPVTPLAIAGFQQMGALAKTGCYPFDRHREGLVLGEGAAVVVLEAETLAHQRGVKPYGWIRGFGLGNDAHHVSAPVPGYSSAIATLHQCLHHSQLTPAQIDQVYVHGTSTQLNDAMEAALMAQVLPPHVAVSATKGATGHTLGASGAINTVFALLGLRDQALPPCIGLQTPAFDLNLIRQPQSSPLQNILCFSFGFGGQNTMLALSQTP
jgi:3-oxoacyl-[acyl-carrier-protein] synthase II